MSFEEWPMSILLKVMNRHVIAFASVPKMTVAPAQTFKWKLN